MDPKPPMTPPEDVEPDSTMSKFVPIDAKIFSTLDFAPSPIATMEITEATPMTTPSAVRKLRVLLRRRARIAMGRVCATFMERCLPRPASALLRRDAVFAARHSLSFRPSSR